MKTDHDFTANEIRHLPKRTRDILLGSAAEKAKPDYEGTKSSKVGPITISCTSPEAHDLLRRIMATYSDHYNPELHTASPDEVYQFAYWLCRWSGLIQPKETQ